MRNLEERLAANEDTFREVNEGIARGQWPGDSAPVAFRCECARLGCTLLLKVPMTDYERIRQHPRWFMLEPGHEVPEIETVVERNDGYVVVEKRGEAGAVAEELDPRS